MPETLFVGASDICEILGVSKSQSYKIIKELNAELAAKGYRTLTGRVSTQYFMEQFYGMPVARKED